MRGVSIRFKLLLAFMLLVAIVGGASYYQLHGIERLSDTFADLVRQDFDRLDRLERIRFISLEMEHLGLQYAYDTQAGSKTYAPKAETLVKQMQNATDQYGQLLVDASDKEALGSHLTSLTTKSDELAKQLVELVDGQATAGSRPVLDKYATLEAQRTELENDINTTVQIEQQKVRAERTTIEASISRSLGTTTILAILVALSATVIGLLVATLLTRSIMSVKQGADRIASGDFSQPIAIRSHDEFGQLAFSFNQMAERLRDSYNRLALQRQRDETLLESMSEGLIAVDNKGEIVLVNNQAIGLLDLDPQETVGGKPIDMVLHLNGEDDKPLAPDQYPHRKAIGVTQPISGIYAIHRNDRKLFMNITAGPVLVNGAAAGVIMVVRDVTHEKEVDRMKTEFISLASHQLRTPLSAIRWFTEMLLSGDAGKLTPEQTEFAQNVADSTERMTDLVNSLLNISRIESGRIMVDPKPTDLNELIGGIVSDLKAKTTTKQQNLVVSVHKELPKVNLDPKLIGQVYLNLLTNAVKYTPKGGEIAVFVSCKGDELVSQVTDNGYGIPKEEQPKMFQKFFRASNVAKVETDGTGLGMYLIKAIIESSGGKIWFESQEGKGTTFWFSLPMSGMKPKQGEVTLDG